MTELLPLALWVPILDGDASATAMFERHYSAARNLDRRRRNGTMLFVGPGEKLVLATPCRRALFAWRRERHRRDDQVGIECTVFRNEGPQLASTMIRAADAIADARWPGERHFTFVDPDSVGGQPPGNCFRHAGWRPVLTEDGEPARTKRRGLLILERRAA